MRNLCLLAFAIVFVGCTTTHNHHAHHGHHHDSRMPASIEPEGDENGDIPLEEDYSDRYHAASYVEIPDDPVFVFGSTEPTERSVLNAGTAFAKNPIVNLGLEKGELVLTCDDGPTRNVTMDVAEALAKYNIKGTFFVVGNRVHGQGAQIVKALKDQGHIIGSHTYTHATDLKDDAHIAREFASAEDAMKNADAYDPDNLYFRAPGLAWNNWRFTKFNSNPDVKKYVGPIHANLGTDGNSSTRAADWACWGGKRSARKSVDGCAQAYYNEIAQKGRGIVLIHDLNPKTPKMTAALLDMLNRNGGIRTGGCSRPRSEGFWCFKNLDEISALDSLRN